MKESPIFDYQLLRQMEDVLEPSNLWENQQVQVGKMETIIWKQKPIDRMRKGKPANLK